MYSSLLEGGWSVTSKDALGLLRDRSTATVWALPQLVVDRTRVPQSVSDSDAQAAKAAALRSHTSAVVTLAGITVREYRLLRARTKVPALGKRTAASE
jgi:hypothetical protein